MTTERQSGAGKQLDEGKPHKKTSARFSIILCTYNRRNLVLSALASLRRQTLAYNQFEVIVVDNGSSDGTLSAVRSYVSAGGQAERKSDDNWQVQCLSEARNGLAHARHTGLLAASGEIAVFVDDDTLAEPHFLERLLLAYDETGADAIGGRVEVRWEAPRPHWLSDDLLDMLGHFAPSSTRMQLPEGASFSSCNFSVKIEALRHSGYFSPFLSKRLHVPASMEVQDLCRRLQQAGYTLVYEPGAAVAHRAPAARLRREYFVGRAYWQGRSEVLTLYAGKLPNGDANRQTLIGALQAIFRELRQLGYLALLHRPLLRLAGRSTNERLKAAMAQASSWGRAQQRFHFLERTPAAMTPISVLFVRSPEPDPTADLLACALGLQGVSCTAASADLPLAWLWRHRAYQGQAIGIIHFYRAGALKLTRRQRQRLSFRLWLARCWGIRIVITDTGGWWQSTRSLRFLSRRALERSLLYTSDMILAYTRQPDQLYPDKHLRQRVRCLPHPGLRGYYAQPAARDEAHAQLGLPTEAGFVYLCLACRQSEGELIQLIEAFGEMRKKEKPPGYPAQLLLVGAPKDKKAPGRILKLAALNPAVHLSLAVPGREEMPLYIGAADAFVLPHLAGQTAGQLETALLALSYGRTVVAPRLPRFNGMLPPRASAFYDPASRASLVKALLKVQTLNFQVSEKEAAALEAESGWGQYAYRLRKLYQRLLSS
jgi:glycosyltransferase involved in cell wall biosynthesis